MCFSPSNVTATRCGPLDIAAGFSVMVPFVREALQKMNEPAAQTQADK